MSPIRASQVTVAQTFESDLQGLRTNYSQIDQVVDEFKSLHKLDYSLPHVPVAQGCHRGVYAVLLDYPPMGSAGRGRFLVTYHATDPDPSWTDPYRTFTLLTITER